MQGTRKTRGSRRRSININVALPEEVLIEIFSKFKIKSLLCCKSVCKYWLQILTSSHFVQLHLQLAKENNPRIIFTSTSTTSRTGTINLDSLEYEKTGNVATNYNLSLPSSLLYIVGSCNGLLCLSDYKTCMVVCNPSTKECVIELFGILEPLPIDYKRKFVMGFGYDPLTNSYKVVRMDISYSTRANASIDASDYNFYVYTLGTKVWRRIQTPGCISSHCNGSAYVNGALHWFMLSKKARWTDKVVEVDSIISFDVGKEKFQYIPAKIFSMEERHHLRVLGGCLCTLVYYYNNKFLDHIDIWMMKEYGVKESWTKLFAINCASKQHHRHIDPLVIGRNGEIILKPSFSGSFEKRMMTSAISLSIEKQKKGLYAYDPALGNTINVYNNIRWISVDTYVESLVSIASLSDEGKKEDKSSCRRRKRFRLPHYPTKGKRKTYKNSSKGRKRKAKASQLLIVSAGFCQATT